MQYLMSGNPWSERRIVNVDHPRVAAIQGGEVKPMNSGFNGDKPLPYSEDAEKGVLCSLKHSPDEVASLCTERVRPEHFLNSRPNKVGLRLVP